MTCDAETIRAIGEVVAIVGATVVTAILFWKLLS